jgi:hypothetical protein
MSSIVTMAEENLLDGTNRAMSLSDNVACSDGQIADLDGGPYQMAQEISLETSSVNNLNLELAVNLAGGKPGAPSNRAKRGRLVAKQ